MNDIEAVAESLRDVKFPVESAQVLSTVTDPYGGRGMWYLTVFVVEDKGDAENHFANFTWAPEVGWTRNGTPVDLQTAVRVWWQHQTGPNVGAEEREIG